MGTKLTGAYALNKKLNLENATDTNESQTDAYLSGSSLISGNTGADSGNASSETVRGEQENKNSDLGIIGRGLAQLAPSIAKGATRALDKISDAPAYIENAIVQKKIEKGNAGYSVQQKAEEVAKKYQEKANTHLLGDSVQNWEKKVDEKQEAIVNDNPNSKLAQTVYKGTELAESVGAMLPTIAAAALTSGVGGAITGTATAGATAATTAASTVANAAAKEAAKAVVGRVAESAGLALMFGNVYSDSIDQSVAQGYDYTSSADKAFRDALTEVGTELLFGGIAGTGKAIVTSKTVNKAAETLGVKTLRETLGDRAAGSVILKGIDILSKMSKSPVGKFLVGDIAEDGLGGILGEAAEEMISEIIGPYNERATTNPNAENATLGEVLEAGLGGAIISAVFGGAQRVGDKLRNASMEKQLQKWQSSPKQTLKNFAAMQSSTSTRDMAKKLFGNFSEELDLNSFGDTFYLPSDLKVEMPTNIDALTNEEAKAELNRVIPELQKSYKELSRRRSLEVMSQEYKETTSATELAAKSKAVVEAQAKLDAATATAREMFGEESVKNGLTKEQNQKLLEAGIDLKTLSKNLIRATNSARINLTRDIESAIADGTAAETYGQETVDGYLANKEISEARKLLEAESEKTEENQSTSQPISFSGYLKTTDSNGATVYRTANQVAESRFGKNYSDLDQVQKLEIASEFNQQRKERLATLESAVAEIRDKIKDSGVGNFNVVIASQERIKKLKKENAGAWWDASSNTIYFNPDKVSTKSSAYVSLAHEVVHKVTDSIEATDPTGEKKRAFFDSVISAMRLSGYPVESVVKKTEDVYTENFTNNAYEHIKEGNLIYPHLREVYAAVKAEAGSGVSEDQIARIAAERFAKDELYGYDENTDKGNVHVDGLIEEEVVARFMEVFLGSSDMLSQLSRINKGSLEMIGDAVRNSVFSSNLLGKTMTRVRYQILSDISSALNGTLESEKSKVESAFPDASKTDKNKETKAKNETGGDETTGTLEMNTPELLSEAPSVDSLGNNLSKTQQQFYGDSIGTRDSYGKLIPLVPAAFEEGSPLTVAGGYYYRPATAADLGKTLFYGKMSRPLRIASEAEAVSTILTDSDTFIKSGYDGVVIGGNIFRFLDSAQLSETTNTNPAMLYDVEMSSILDDVSNNINSEQFAPFNMSGITNDTGVSGVSDERLRQYEELKAKFGLYEDTSIPSMLNEHVATNKTYGRLIDDTKTPSQLRGLLINQLLDGIGGHLVMTDDAAIDYVRSQMNKYKTLNEAVDKTTEVFASGRMVNKNDLALGQQLILDLGNEINRINAYNETVTGESLKKDAAPLVNMTEELLAKVCAAGSRAGQNLQAMALLKKLTPQGRLYYIDAQVDQYLSEMVDRRGNSRVGGFQFKKDSKGRIVKDENGRAVRISIPEELRTKMLNCTTREQLDAVEEEIVTAIAEQIPPSLSDRIVAWRYLSMLGNPRTHIRNIVSNIAMGGLVDAKNTLKGALEDAILGDKTSGRTATNKRIDPELRKAYQEFAIEDWDNDGISDEALSGGKVGFQSRINEKRNKFGTSKFAEKLNEINRLNTNGLKGKEGTLLGGLEGEDYWSGKRAYVHAFTKYCAANNLSVEYLKSGTMQANTALAQARSYAVNEAAKATYHDANNLAQHLNQIEKQNGTLSAIIVGGLVPFKKTPGNILKRGIEYSPVGILTGTVELLKATQSTVEDYSGEYSALSSEDAMDLGKSEKRFDAEAKRTRAICDAIDKLASGLTGTGILLLGYFLGSLGILKGSGSDNDREEYYDQMLGNQQFSITIGGKNFTLDWLTPASMPLFSGVAIADLTSGDFDLSTGDVLTGLSKIADPVMNLSVLQGVNDALSSYDSGLGKVVLSAAEGYASQMIPTLAGQIARTIDPTRRTTYAPKDDSNASSKEVQTFVNRMLNKIPFASMSNQEYIDMWGRPESRGDSFVGRLFSQSIAPWYEKDVTKTKADDLVAKVYAETNDRSVIPTSPESSYTINKETYRLSESEYHDTKETVGQLSSIGITTLMDVPGFSSLSPEEQADLMVDVYEFARKVDKSDFAMAHSLDYAEESSTTRIKNAVAAGMTIGEAIYVYYLANSLTADKDENGKTISGSKKKKVLDLYATMGLTEAQIRAISIYDIE